MVEKIKQLNKSMDVTEFLNLINNILPGYDANNNNIENLSSEIYFEKLSINGLEEMHKYSTNPRLYEYFEFEPFKNIEETKLYIEKLLDRMSGKYDKNAIYWFVRRKIDNRLVGTAGLLNISYSRNSTEWGYGVDPELWGNGYILQIQEILKQYVFEILQLNRLDGITMITNERTISSLLAVGFKQEGILRHFYCKNDVFIDGWKYAILKEEYFQLKIEESHVIELIPTEGVIELIQSVLEEEIIDGRSDMRNTKSWDSLNHMNIIVAIYSKYGFQLTPNQVAKARSVSQIYQILNAKKLDNLG